MVQFARRLAGLLVAVALTAGLPLAAARAGCLCDHAHAHATAAAPHTCTAACTAATCPMHRRAAAGTSHAGSAARDGVRCSCSGDAQALIGQATTIAVLPSLAQFAAPSSGLPAALPAAATAPSLHPSPPAPPPRA